jgi:glycosyltransferase involved in cell wall biosynthesis
MRLLLVNTVATAKSGIPMVIFNLLDKLVAPGLEIGYVSINEPEEYFLKRLEANGVRLYVIPRRVSSAPKYIAALARVARGYDVMHAHGNSATLTLEMLAARIAGVPLRISHSHNTKCVMRAFDKMLRPLFHSLCNGRMACGDAAGRWLFGQRQFCIIYNGVDTDRFAFSADSRQAMRQALGWSDKNIVGNVANFDPAKNHEFILQVFKAYAAENPDARLLLVGAGSSEQHYKDRTEELGIADKVKFVGSVANPEDYLAAMDVVLMPSLFEGFPLTLVEEQANGLTCVISDAITDAVNLTGNVRFVSLEAEIPVWTAELAKAVAALSCEDRADISQKAIEDIRHAGFDNALQAKALRQYYEANLAQVQK